MPPLIAATLTNQVVTLKVQGMTRRAIARALGISRNTVRKVPEAHALTRASEHSALPAAPSPAPRPPGKADSYTEKIMGLLAKYPDITAQRIFEELREAGYDGGYTAPFAGVKTLCASYIEVAANGRRAARIKAHIATCERSLRSSCSCKRRRKNRRNTA